MSFNLDEITEGLKDMATYDCGFEEQSDIALAAADVIVTLLVEVTSLRKHLDAAVEENKLVYAAILSYGPEVVHDVTSRVIKWRGAERSE